MLKLTDNFVVAEFVPLEIYNQYFDNSIWFFNYKLPIIAQFIRDRYNKKVIVNDSFYGGKYNYSCFRVPPSKEYKPTSQHALGNAIDIKGVDPTQLRKDITDNYEKIWKPLGVTTIESNTSTWTHIDLRNTNSDKLLIVKG